MERDYDEDAGKNGWMGEILAGHKSVDAWQVAHRVSVCCSTYERRAYEGGILDVAHRCDYWLVCPHCAHARAGEYARATRRVMASLLEDGPWRGAADLPVVGVVDESALITLTQRALPGETLSHALFRATHALRKLWGSRSSPRWRWELKGRDVGGHYQVEIVRSWPGKADGKPRPCWSRCWWHVHVHIVAVGQGLHELKERWAGRWQRHTEDASNAVYQDDSGAADPASRADGRWWTPIDTEDLHEVYQATKYLAADIKELKPAELLELLTITKGAKLSGDFGSMHGLIRQSKALEEAGQPDPSPPEVEPPDFGALLVEEAPGFRTDEPPLTANWALVQSLVSGDTPGLASMVRDWVAPEAKFLPTTSLSWSQWLDAAAAATDVRLQEWRVEVAGLGAERAAARLAASDAVDESEDGPGHRLALAAEVVSNEQEHLSRLRDESGQRLKHALWAADFDDLLSG